MYGIVYCTYIWLLFTCFDELSLRILPPPKKINICIYTILLPVQQASAVNPAKSLSVILVAKVAEQYLFPQLIIAQDSVMSCVSRGGGGGAVFVI
jgi:hypothetical protein